MDEVSDTTFDKKREADDFDAEKPRKKTRNGGYMVIRLLVPNKVRKWHAFRVFDTFR